MPIPARFLLVLLPLGVTVLAYDGAVQAALAYAETVYVAFGLHPANLLTPLRTDPPTQQDAERILNQTMVRPVAAGDLPAIHTGVLSRTGATLNWRTDHAQWLSAGPPLARK